MSNAGRPRDTKASKIKKGTYRADRDPDSPLSFEVLSAVPMPKKQLTKHQQDFFDFACKALLDAGVLMGVDVIPITKAATWWGLYVRAMEEIDKDNLMNVGQNKYCQINGWVTLLEKASNHLDSFCNKYGFNLVSREKIAMPEHNDGDDELDRIRNG